MVVRRSAGKHNSSPSIFDIPRFAYHISLLGGVLWTIFFFAFETGAFPDMSIESAAPFLLVVFVTGLILFVSILVMFVLPGLIFSSLHRSEASLSDWLHEKQLRFVEHRFLLFATPLLLAALVIAVFSASLQLTRCSEYNKEYNLLLASIVLFVAPATITTCAFGQAKRSLKKWALFLASFFILLPTAIILKLALIADPLEFWIFTIVTLLFTSILNGEIAVLVFRQSSRELLSRVGAILLAFFVLVFFLPPSRTGSNPLFVAPFKLLRLGQIDAVLLLNEDYANALRASASVPGLLHNSNSMNVFVLSSMGNEYIVRIPEKPEDQNKSDKKSASSSGVGRIPKNKVVLVKYLDRTRQKEPRCE